MSYRFELNKEDMKKVGKGCLIAAGGAVLTYLAGVVGFIDFGASTPFIVMGVGVLINFLRKFVTEK